MTRFTTLVAALAAVPAALLAAPIAPAHAAEGGVYQCAPNVPGGEVMTCVPAAPGTAVIAATPPAPAPVAAPAAPAERSLKSRTHNWLAPTGNLLRAGDAELSVHEFIYADAAIGITDNLELNFSMPILPVFASIGGRVGLTSAASPFKLVVGATAYFPLFAEGAEDGALLTQASLTAGYSTDTLNLHGTLSIMKPTGEDESLAIVNIGGSFRIGRKVAIMGELVQFTVGEPGDAPESIGMSMIGLKFMGESTDVDLGLAFPHLPSESHDDCYEGCYDSDDDDLVAMPVLSMSYKF
jgi:hypothetical protein